MFSFGLREVPEGTPAAMGARWIYPNDVVWDRVSFYPKHPKDPEATPNTEMDNLIKWLDGVAMHKAVQKMATRPVYPEENRTIVLYEDAVGIIKGNPQGSHGYLYVCAYLKEGWRDKIAWMLWAKGSKIVHAMTPESTIKTLCNRTLGNPVVHSFPFIDALCINGICPKCKEKMS